MYQPGYLLDKWHATKLMKCVHMFVLIPFGGRKRDFLCKSAAYNLLRHSVVIYPQPSSAALWPI